MGRTSVESLCKICGAKAIVKKYSSKGQTGKKYYYEKFTHKNGIVHYFREGKNTPKMAISEAFDQMIDKKMSKGSYRFKDLKAMFESIYGNAVSNTTIYRNLVKSLKMNLIERKTEGTIILYSKKFESDLDQQLRISKASMSFLIFKNRVYVTIFLSFENPGNKLLAKIPIALPVGIIDSTDHLKLRVFDGISEISPENINLAYSYSGQTGLSIYLNRPLRPSDEDFILLSGDFEIREKFLKFAMPSTTAKLRINVSIETDQGVNISKRLLDGLKESNPDKVSRGRNDDKQFYYEAEFENVLKGEAIFISFGEEVQD